MRLIFSTIIGLVALTSGALADGLELKIENLKDGYFGTADAIVRVENKSGRSYSMVFVDCAFIGEGGQAVETGMALISNLGSGQTGYGEANAINGDAVKSVKCRISQTM